MCLHSRNARTVCVWRPNRATAAKSRSARASSHKAPSRSKARSGSKARSRSVVRSRKAIRNNSGVRSRRSSAARRSQSRGRTASTDKRSSKGRSVADAKKGKGGVNCYSVYLKTKLANITLNKVRSRDLAYHGLPVRAFLCNGSMPMTVTREHLVEWLYRSNERGEHRLAGIAPEL